MSRRPPSPPQRGPSSRVVERLYALWIASSLLLLLLIAVLTLFVTGIVRRQSQALSSLDQRLAALEDRFAEPGPAAGALLERRPRGVPPVAAPGRAPATAAASPTTSARVEPALDEATVNRLLEQVLRPGAELPLVLADRQAAAGALKELSARAAQARWSGATWARLASLARLLERGDLARSWVRRAEAAGLVPRRYYELSARLALRANQPAEALAFLRRLNPQGPAGPVERVLAAQAYGVEGNYAEADRILEGLAGVGSLRPHDQLRLGYMLIELERWEWLGKLLESLGKLPVELEAERDFLRAVWLIQQERLAEALAILEYLLERHPDDYDIRTWRGVALLKAGQLQAAREALSQAAENPVRPEAWYWLGMLEIRLGRPQAATPQLQKAFAASARYAPAWEALGTLALNRGELAQALESFRRAAEINPRRATAHFLIALAQAKAGRRRAAASALQQAFALDPALLKTAARTEALTRLFDTGQLEKLAATRPSPPAEQPPPPPETP